MLVLFVQGFNYICINKNTPISLRVEKSRAIILNTYLMYIEFQSKPRTPFCDLTTMSSQK